MTTELTFMDHWQIFFLCAVCFCEHQMRNPIFQSDFAFGRVFFSKKYTRICQLSLPVFLHNNRRIYMEQTPSRIALIGIVVENNDSVEQLNSLLSQYGSYIIGRMGIPYREKNLSIISIAMDAPNDVISALSGKIGMLSGISSKTIYAKTTSPEL